jgi:hypothetical protein
MSRRDFPPGGGISNLDDEATAEHFGEILPSRIARHYKISVDDAHKLHQYANLKRGAVEHRLKGDITRAVRTEESMDRIYQTLPAKCRW